MEWKVIENEIDWEEVMPSFRSSEDMMKIDAYPFLFPRIHFGWKVNSDVAQTLIRCEVLIDLSREREAADQMQWSGKTAGKEGASASLR